jgi:hypothetical protein
MKHLTIKRLETGSQGTFGALIYESIPFTLTLERQWLNNRASVGDVPGSCIPAGEYMCERVDSPRFGNTFEVKGVEGRSHILFHKGNLDDDSRGCILLGERFGNLGDSSGILSSKQGYNELMSLMFDDNEFRLTIIDCFGE